VDWRLVPAALLVLFALWILAAAALACSTRFDMIPTLAICSALFLLGMMSDYLFGRRAEPVWRHDMTEEVGSTRWTESQRSLLKGMVAQYDQDKDGKLESAEREKISAEDQARLRQAGMGGAWWASALYTATPNWQLFWVADALETGKSVFHWSYVLKAFAYMAAYVGAALAVAVVFFQERELS
jgi:ABC-type Fe3+-siderophore transport system permease subunit